MASEKTEKAFVCSVEIMDPKATPDMGRSYVKRLAHNISMCTAR